MFLAEVDLMIISVFLGFVIFISLGHLNSYLLDKFFENISASKYIFISFAIPFVLAVSFSNILLQFFNI